MVWECDFMVFDRFLNGVGMFWDGVGSGLGWFGSVWGRFLTGFCMILDSFEVFWYGFGVFGDGLGVFWGWFEHVC